MYCCVEVSIGVVVALVVVAVDMFVCRGAVVTLLLLARTVVVVTVAVNTRDISRSSL